MGPPACSDLDEVVVMAALALPLFVVDTKLFPFVKRPNDEIRRFGSKKPPKTLKNNKLDVLDAWMLDNNIG